MMVLPVIFLLLGVALGKIFVPGGGLEHIDSMVTITLSIVIFAAGIDVGAKKIIFNKLREYHAKVLLIPLCSVVGSIGAGVALGKLLGIPLNEAASIAAGFGYYSLSAGILTGLGGASLGSLAFITNAFREVLSLLLIPFIAKYIGPYCAIVPGGATTMDTTLGIISRCTNEEITIMAMIHGVVLTALVPVIVPFLYNL